MPYKIAGYDFSSKKKIQEFCSNQLRTSAETGQPMNYKFWVDLVLASEYEEHDWLREAVKNGEVLYFYGEARDKNYGPYAEMSRGRKEAFSYRKCISAPSPKTKLKAAFRVAVRDDIQAFKDRQVASGISNCGISGDRLVDGDIHVDHIDPRFDQIAENFIAEKMANIPLRNIKFGPSAIYKYEKTACMVVVGAYEWLMKAFRQYHAELTEINTPNCVKHLRLTTASANLTRKGA